MSHVPSRFFLRLSGPQAAGLLLLVLFLLLLGLAGELDNFFRLSSLQVLLYNNTVQGVAALGMLLVIVSGGIDLSLGSVVALVTVVMIQSFRLTHDGPQAALPATLIDWLREHGLLWQASQSVALASAVALAAGLVAGILCGLGNGLAITRLHVPAFVATLGMMSIARGLAFWLSGKTRISFADQPGWVRALARVDSSLLLFNPGVWILGLLALVVFLLLRFTVFGRYCYAIGANEAAARLCGVAVERQKLRIYLLAGLFAFVAGVLSLAKGNGGGPDTAVGLELEVIAAVVIGGASLSGGEGTVLGTLVGVLVLGVLEHSLTLFGVPLDLKYIVIGAVVVAKMALSQWQQRRSA